MTEKILGGMRYAAKGQDSLNEEKDASMVELVGIFIRNKDSKETWSYVDG